MALGDLSIYCLLDPRYRIHQLIPPLLHQFDSKGVLRIDCPDDQHPIFLQFSHRNLLNELIAQGIVLNGDSPGGLGSGQFPGWVHHDDIEVALRQLQLLLYEEVEVKIGHICTNRHRILIHIRPTA